MRKRRKKPLEKRLENRKDKEFSLCIRNRDKRCIICGTTEYLNTAHILPREMKMFRWDKDNAITLCAKHHKFDLFSFHRNPFLIILWLIVHRKTQIDRLIKKIVDVEELKSFLKRSKHAKN